MKPGMQIMPRRVDDARSRRGDLRRDRDDRAVAHVHVAAREIADRRVHRQHGGAADDELAARRQRFRRPAPRARRGLREDTRRAGERRRGEGRARLENRPTIDHWRVFHTFVA